MATAADETGWAQEDLLFSDSQLKCENSHTKGIFCMQAASVHAEGQAALGITSHTVVLTELPNAHVMERAWGLSVVMSDSF